MSRDAGSLSDAALLAGVAAGDVASFEGLYRRHASACAGRARGVLACDDWVNDVVQNVFLDVWRVADRFDPQRGSALRWLLSLTHHKAVDVVRQRQRQNDRWAHEDRLESHLDEAPGPESAATRHDTVRQLRRALAQVPDPHREAVRLCFLEGLSQREAARALGVPLGTVKSRSHQGVIALRSIVPTSLCRELTAS